MAIHNTYIYIYIWSNHRYLFIGIMLVDHMGSLFFFACIMLNGLMCYIQVIVIIIPPYCDPIVIFW